MKGWQFVYEDGPDVNIFLQQEGNTFMCIIHMSWHIFPFFKISSLLCVPVLTTCVIFFRNCRSNTSCV